MIENENRSVRRRRHTAAVQSGFSCFLAGIVLLLIPFFARASQPGWKAGAAKTLITPPIGMWMSGYANRNRPAEGKLTDLWAKALMLEDQSGHRVVLVTFDLIGVDRELSQSICARLHQRYGLSRQQIALCFSHTHTGPVVGRNLESMHLAVVEPDQQRKIIEYARALEASVVELVGQAQEALGACELTWGSGTANFAVNRRNNLEREVPELRAQEKLVGPFDHDVPVLAVRNHESDLIAVVFGYACHATVLSSYKWSGDYPGFAQLAVEREHPDCIAMFWAGCGGDQNPIPRRQEELARKYGEQLGKSVSDVLRQPMTALPPTLQASYREIPLTLDQIPTRDEMVQDTKSKNRFVAARARLLLGQLDREGEVDRNYPYPIAQWRLGKQIDWLFLGGEVVVDYALRLKSERLGTRTWVAAYANDVMAYIPSLRVWREGGYEGGGSMVYYGLPSRWSSDVEERVVSATAKIPPVARPTVQVEAVGDFEVTGDGSNPAWKKAKWIPLNRRGSAGNDYATQVKVLYSPSGLYVLLDATDRILTASMEQDFDDLWNEDVFEVFLWTDERYPVYFEYEISPLEKELPILVPNLGGDFLGWRPWHYEGDRKTRKRVKIVGGKQETGAKIEGWRAEVFIPYDLLKPLRSVPPKSGTRWRANFYRMDYDEEKKTAWDWARVGPSFHEFQKFGTLVFR